VSKNQRVTELARLRLLSACVANGVRSIARAADVVYVQEGDRVYSQGSREFLVMLDGQAEIRSSHASRRLVAGDTYGAVRLLGGNDPAEVRMTDAGRVLIIGPREFSSLMRYVPGLAIGVARELARAVAPAPAARSA
jgi:hypothetical protein